MQKLLLGMLAGYLIVGIGFGVFTIATKGNSDKTATVSDSYDEWYPDDQREDIEIEEETEPKDSEDEIIEEEITPDKDFKEFDVEDDEEEAIAGDLCTVNQEKVNLRMAGDKGAEILRVVRRGEKGVMLEEGEKWTKVEFDGSIGYISTSCLVLQSTNQEEYDKWVGMYVPEEETEEEEE